jgi:hypothetical protein
VHHDEAGDASHAGDLLARTSIRLILEEYEPEDTYIQDSTKAISCSKVPPHIREGITLEIIPSKSHKGTPQVLGGGRQSRLGECIASFETQQNVR